MVFEAHCMSFPYRTLIIQLCQDKDSFPFYGTFNFKAQQPLNQTLAALFTLRSF